SPHPVSLTHFLSDSCKTLFPQLPCFVSHAKPPGVGVPTCRNSLLTLSHSLQRVQIHLPYFQSLPHSLRKTTGVYPKHSQSGNPSVLPASLPSLYMDSSPRSRHNHSRIYPTVSLPLFEEGQ